jgi:hypothetical protein
MARWEQYEVWALCGVSRQLVAAFPSLELATAVAQARKDRIRLVRASYEDAKRVQEEILLEIGSTRDSVDVQHGEQSAKRTRFGILRRKRRAA